MWRKTEEDVEEKTGRCGGKEVWRKRGVEEKNTNILNRLYPLIYFFKF